MLARLLIMGLAIASLCAKAGDYTFRPALPLLGLADVPLMDVAACGDKLLAVGERGLVIYSGDGGANWVQASVPVSQTLTAVYCLRSGEAWAVGHGGAIIASTDGGISWELQLTGNAANEQWLAFTRLQAQDLAAELAVAEAEERDDTEDLAYALEESEFAISDAEEAVATGPADPFLDVWFRNEDFGIAVGAYGMIYRSYDGGAQWQLSVAGIENIDRYHFYSITEAVSGALFLSGEAGLLYRSRDQGDSWEQLESGYSGTLFGVIATRDRALLAFGLRGNILRSEDDGDSWQSVAVAQDDRLSLYGGAELEDGTVALIGASGVVLSSDDGGKQFTSSILAARNTLSAIAGANLKDAVVVGMTGVESLLERANEQ